MGCNLWHSKLTDQLNLSVKNCDLFLIKYCFLTNHAATSTRRFDQLQYNPKKSERKNSSRFPRVTGLNLKVLKTMIILKARLIHQTEMN